MKYLMIALALIACTDAPTAARRSLPPRAASFVLSAPTGLVVDAVDGLTVTAHWDAVPGAGGYYLALSDASDVGATKRYQIVYGGLTTAGTITAYQGEGGCYLVSVFGWSLTDADSPWVTVGPVSVGGPCSTATATAKKKGHK
jgi:hypothetical protein